MRARRAALAAAAAASLAGCAPQPPLSPRAGAACEPAGPVTATVSGVARAGVSSEGFVSDSDVDLVVAVTPGVTGCR